MKFLANNSLEKDKSFCRSCFLDCIFKYSIYLLNLKLIDKRVCFGKDVFSDTLEMNKKLV